MKASLVDLGNVTHGCQVVLDRNGDSVDDFTVQFGYDNRMTKLPVTWHCRTANKRPQKVANVQPSIIKEFGEVSKLSWLGTAFALGSASTILPWYARQVHQEHGAKSP